MEEIYIDKKPTFKSESKSFYLQDESMELVVIEDKKLTNMLFSKTLQSTIERIGNLKKFPIKFSSFQSGKDFVKYLDKKEFGKSSLIVFSDNDLERELSADTLFKAKQKGIDLKMIVMAESATGQSSTNIKNANNHIQKYNTIPIVSSQVIEKMVI